MNWLDLGLIIFIIIFVVIGIKRGLMNSMLSHFSFGINALLSFFVCKPIGWIFNKCGLGTAIASSYSSKMLSASPDFGKNLLDIAESDLSGFVSSTIDSGPFSGLTKSIFNIFINNDNLYNTLHSSDHTSRTLADIISGAYSTFFVNIISFVTSILLLYLIVWLFKLLANKLRTIGFVKFVDNALGSIYGIFKCLIILMIICLIIKLLSPIGFMEPVISYINSSLFGKFIYSQINNFFDNYLNFNDLVNVIFKH